MRSVMMMIWTLALVLGSGAALACSDVALPVAKGEGAVVFSARTMDFDPGYKSWFVKVPRGQEFQAQAPGKGGKTTKGAAWKAKYGYLCICILPEKYDLEKDQIPPQILPFSEGQNEQGLSVGALWLGRAEFQHPDKATAAKNYVDVGSLMAFVLSNCATTDEAVTLLQGVRVWTPESEKTFSPLHLSLHDASGRSIVVEYVGGERRIYENELGVLTNEPPYDWQAINFKYLYAGLGAQDSRVDEYVGFISGKDGVLHMSARNWESEVLGSGMVGMPGDSTSISRFVRLALLRKATAAPKSAAEGVELAQQLIGRVSVTDGEVAGDAGGDVTLWWVVQDHTEKKMYYASRFDRDLKVIPLSELDLSEGSGVRFMPMDDKTDYPDMAAGLGAQKAGTAK